MSIHFGTYKIPETSLIGRSDGIYISVPSGASVKNIADGEVSSVYDLGGEQAVTVRHGKYFTTYSHLSTVNVSQGQTVRPGTVVGKAAANDSGEGEVLFMVINERSQFLNPGAVAEQEVSGCAAYKQKSPRLSEAKNFDLWVLRLAHYPPVSHAQRLTRLY